MSSDPVWKRDAIDSEHPSREAILAFIREQCAELEKNSINEHLLTGCVPCNRIHTESKQSIHALNHLNYMSRYLYYPEVQSNQVLLHMRRGVPLTSVLTGKRKRKFQTQQSPVGKPQAARYVHKTDLRFISIPAAFAMFILCVLLVATVVYALATIGKLPLSNVLPINIFHTDRGPNTTSITTHQMTPTATVALTTGSSPGATVSPTLPATIIMGANLEVCKGSPNSGPIIFICGHGFTGVNKIWLEIAFYGSDSLKTIGPFSITGSGELKMPVRIFLSCKNSPVTIYAGNKTQQPLTLPLTNISRSDCSLPTPTVTPWGHH